MSRLLLLLSALSLPAMAAAEPTLFGRYEQIKIEDLGKTLKAKMDTGAMTASLSARDIERFERDGEDWVRFRLAVEGAGDTLYERPLARIAEIKTRAEEADPDDDTDLERGPDVAERPVVEMQLCIGDRLREAEVNLTDRSHFRYPLLIGATAIRDLDAAIDPSQKYTAGRPTC
ncbi:ATP-dependent zinc protease [Pseudomonas sp. Q2-TVG4-2]|uniref:retropepsin-like aspartic peptidase RloA2 n=1 Tax=Pseudomonas sp. Q2-TVG4-2 TaxID=1685699 RepID=UPI0015E63301|nr:ATP-dependent zinc protease [Pseudomonas sp. Q2-TVG4-2]